MITIEIREEVENPSDMVDVLNEVATMIQKGYTSGYHPGWSMDGTYEEDCDYCEGMGERTVSVEGDSGVGEIQKEECGRCKGTGKIEKTV